ncbi:MAG: hypothetical protein SF053_05935 [Bacteroidia bacterium]|nr:hypothetical protein [Bacteroidia bacterium]
MRNLALLLLMVPALSGDGGLLNEANRLATAQQYLLAIEQYQEALKVYPERATEIRYNMGVLYMQADSQEAALAMFHQAVQPAMPLWASHASNNIGFLLVMRAQEREALAAFRQALVYDVNNEEARYNYELLRKRMRPEAPPPAATQPPPPAGMPEQEAPEPPQLSDPADQALLEKLMKKRQRGPLLNDRGVFVGSDTLPLAEARRLLDELRQSDRQFIQQMRKSPTISTGDKKNDW